MNFSAPIPGESLTREPGNAPWEQPPLYSKMGDSLDFYMKRLEDDDTMEEVFGLLEGGLPVSTLVDTLTSVGVMEGYHTIDVSILLQPVLTDYISEMADVAGVEFKKDNKPSKEDEKRRRIKQRAMLIFGKQMSDEEDEEEEMPIEPSPIEAEPSSSFIQRPMPKGEM